VRLEPLSVEHVEGIAEAASGDRSTFGFTAVPDGLEDAGRYVRQLLDDAAAGRVAPFVQRRVATGELVGCTRYLYPHWPLGRDDPDEVEIGGTWLSPAAQRSGVNTDAKLLLLTHAFEAWKVQRVAICTDARNDRSRRAIERLGAAFEGVLRRHRASYVVGETNLRDTAVYALIAPDWPDVRDRLQSLLDAVASPPGE
jgi:RimJ/RimL family protein N-acetyltransferase